MCRVFNVIAILVAPLLATTTSFSQERRDEEAPLIQRTVLPESIYGQAWRSEVDLGTLTSGKKYRIKINIQNPSGTLMSFAKLTKSCACFDTQLSGLILKPDGVISVELTAPVPTKMGREDASWTFSLDHAPEKQMSGLHVKMKYTIAGLLEFLERRVVCESRAAYGEEHFLIPLLLTAPVQASNLHFHFPVDLAEIRGQAIVKDNKHFLQISVNSEKIKSRYLAGEIGCVDTLTGREDSVYCVIKKSGGVSVHPAILRVATSEDSGYHATAVIRVAPAASTDRKLSDGNAEKRNDVLIDALIDDTPLQLTVDRLSDSAFRARVAFPDELVKFIEKSPRAEVRWVIRTDESTHEISSRVSKR